MAVIFPRWTNMVVPLLLLLAPGGAIAGLAGVWYWFSPEYTDVGYAPEQPVEYSHKLHAGELGLDCRYCHNTVERGARAAVPPVSTCMNCHGVVKTDSKELEPIRRAAAEPNASVDWVRVHMLPDYAYFDHSVHAAATIGCVTCHGRVDQMVVVAQNEPLSMGWCLSCHNDPGPNLRPQAELTNMAWEAEGSGYDPHELDRFPSPPTHCSGCHR